MISCLRKAGKLLAEGRRGWISICQKLTSLTPQHCEQHTKMHLHEEATKKYEETIQTN